MSLANYTDLVASVSNWLHRSDLDSTIPDLVRLAESRISRDLKVQSLEKESTILTVGGQQSYTFPDDLVSLVRMFVTDSSGNIAVLQGYDPTTYRYNNASQQPRYFYVEADTLKLSPTPDGIYTVTVVYKGAVPSLQDNSTNVIMTKYPNIYLMGTLAEAGQFIKDDERLNICESRYMQAVKDANAAEDFREHNLLATEAYAMLPRRSYDIRVM